jgi:hypothetical protein
MRAFIVSVCAVAGIASLGAAPTYAGQLRTGRLFSFDGDPVCTITNVNMNRSLKIKSMLILDDFGHDQTKTNACVTEWNNVLGPGASCEVVGEDPFNGFWCYAVFDARPSEARLVVSNLVGADTPVALDGH